MAASVKNKYPYQDLSLKDRDGEKWDDIPFLDGAYQISNYGRIKSLRRWIEVFGKGGRWSVERILKTRAGMQIVSGGKRKLFRLTIMISFEGKKYFLSIARMVYCLFVEKFDLGDRRLVVSCKDEDAFNLCPDNLKLTTPAKNISKAYKMKRRPRESFGNKARTISQYDLNGKWICTHLSLSQAAKSTGIESSGLSESLKHKRDYAGGYMWRFGNDKRKITVPESIKKKLASEKFHSTIVTQYDLQGNKLKEHSNLKAAAKKVKIQPNQIRSVILGVHISAKRSYWILGQGPDKIAMTELEKRVKQGKENICRPVTQYDLQGKRIRSYDSIADAGRSLAIRPSNIYDALNNGYNRISRGYIWKYGKGPLRIKVNSVIKRKRNLQQLYGQPVTQYSKHGKPIACYSTLKAAARAVGGQTHGLVATLEGKHLTFKDYFWRFGKGRTKINVTEALVALHARVVKMSKPVIQFDLKGKKIKEYESISAASRSTNTSSGQIRAVSLGKYKAAKGFLWKFKDNVLE